MSAQEVQHSGPLQALDRVTNRLTLIAVVIGCVLTAGITLWIVADVAGRLFGISGITGTVTVAADTVVAISFLFMPYALRQRGHIRSTIVVSRASKRTADITLGLSYALGGLIFAFIAWASWGDMVSNWVTGAYTGEGALRVPTAPFQTVVVVASILMVLECLLATEQTFRRSRTGQEGGSSDE